MGGNARLQEEWNRLHSAPRSAEAILDLAELCLRTGHLAEARACAVEALEKALASNAQASVARSHLVRAECELRESGAAAAEIYLSKGFRTAVASGDPALEGLARRVAARVALAFGQAEEAIDVAGTSDDPDRIATVAHAHIERLEFSRAQAAVTRGLSLAPEFGWRLHDAAARFHETWGAVDDARKHREEAIRAIRELDSLVPGGSDPERTEVLSRKPPQWLLEILKRINLAGDLGSLADYVVHIAVRTCGAARGLLRISGPPEIVASRRGDGRPLGDAEMQISRHVVEQAVRTGAPVVTNDAAAHPEFGKFDSVQALQIRSIFCLPLTTRGRAVGYLYLDHGRSDRSFGEEERGVVLALAQQIGLLIDNATLHAASARDPLTGFASHPHFERVLQEELARARRYGESLSLLRADLDHFKLVIDAHGYDGANRTLQESAKWIASILPPRALLARVDGDEFEILLPGGDETAARTTANKILECFRGRKFEFGPARFAVTMSLGGATWPKDGRSAGALFLQADASLFQAKSNGRDQYWSPAFPAPAARADVHDAQTDSLLLSRAGRAVLSMVNTILEEGGDAEQALQATLRTMARAVAAASGTIALFDDRKEVRTVASLGQAPSLSAIRKVVDTERPLRIEQCEEHAWAQEQKSISAKSITSVLVVPIRFRNRPVGIVYLDKREGGASFSEDDLRLLDQFAQRAAPLLVRTVEADDTKRRADRLERIAASNLHELRRRSGFAQIVGRATSMQKLFTLLEKVAKLDYSVVVEGETGSGKELVARAIHFESPRKEKPFVPVNCGSLAETLLESELFGHAKGSFTGADANRVGLFEAAQGGTIFLDEIEEMSEGMQTKLLRVLEDRKIRAVGSTREVPIDVRVVAATNVVLKDLIKEKKFREDLYYRLATLTVSVPPLRERTEDLPLLVDHFMKEIAEETKTEPKRFAPAAMSRLVAYPWPGNVRELKNVLRGLTLVQETDIQEEHLPAQLKPQQVAPVVGSYRHQVEAAEREIILRALGENQGNVRRTARALRMPRSTLLRKMDRYKLSGDLDPGEG